jgi:hypothetical protein
LTPKQNEASNTTHKELCDQALKHYQEISDKACHFNSIVPKAIEFYKNMPQNLPQECLKSCCKLAYSAGWWAKTRSARTARTARPARPARPAMDVINKKD